MKKKTFCTIALVLVALLAACLSACEKAEVPYVPDQPSDVGEEPVAESVRVSFYSDGLLYGIAVCAGDVFAMPSDPHKTGYSFAGWFYDENFTTPFIYEEFVAKKDKTDISLYAAWNALPEQDPEEPSDEDKDDDQGGSDIPEVVTHTVTFVLDGVVVSTQKVEDGKSAALPVEQYRADGNSLLSLSVNGNYTAVTGDETVTLSYLPATERDKELFALGFSTLRLDTGSGSFYLESISADYPFDWLVAPSSWGIFTVRGITGNAFARVPQLRYVRLGEKYTEMDWSAFASLPLLESVEFDEDNPSYSADGLFVTDKSGKELIKYVGRDGGELTVPDGIASLADGVFEGSGFSEIVLPAGLTEIGERAFAGSAFLECVTVPDSVTAIGTGAFENCIMLKEAVIPRSLDVLGNRAFAGCVSVTEVRYGATDLQALVKDNATFDGTGATSGLVLNIGEGVLSVPARLFDGEGAGTLHLREIVFAENCTVTSIGSQAFAYTGITSVTIPASVTSLGSDAFRGCAALVEVYYRAQNAVSQGISGSAFDGAGAENSVFTIGKEVVSVPDWLLYFIDGKANFGRLVFEEGKLESIGVQAFAGVPFEGSVTLPSTVSEIGEGAFSESGIEAIYVADGNLSFSSADGVLFSADGRELVAYPAGRADESYTVTADTEEIKAYAFAGADKLNEIQIYCARVGNAAFNACTGIKVLTLGEGVETIGQSAFYGCSSVAEIVCPSTLKAIGENAFSRCDALVSVSLNQGLESIGSRAFAYCPALGEVDVPSSVTQLGSDVFAK